MTRVLVVDMATSTPYDILVPELYSNDIEEYLSLYGFKINNITWSVVKNEIEELDFFLEKIRVEFKTEADVYIRSHCDTPLEEIVSNLQKNFTASINVSSGAWVSMGINDEGIKGIEDNTEEDY